MANPLDQFTIKTLIPLQVGGVDLSFTNSSLMMLISLVLCVAFIAVGLRRRAMVPGRYQSLVEVSYEFVANTLKENAGSEAMRYFPFVFTLFLFIATMNLLGMIPFAFTATSHIIVTFGLAIAVFLFTTIIGLALHGLHFFSLFAPAGVPFWLYPILIPVEIISYLARPVSLSLRLAINMMVGHTIMKLVAGFVFSLGLLGGWLPLAFLVGFTGFEIFIAILQAYVFTILTCVYLNDAIHLH